LLPMFPYKQDTKLQFYGWRRFTLKKPNQIPDSGYTHSYSATSNYYVMCERRCGSDVPKMTRKQILAESIITSPSAIPWVAMAMAVQDPTVPGTNDSNVVTISHLPYTLQGLKHRSGTP
jgi:hypothetical protein